MLTRDGILDTLDRKHNDTRDALIPSLNFGYFQYVGGRLSVFADSTTWCLLLEAFGWDPYIGRTKHSQIGAQLFAYGTAVPSHVTPVSQPWDLQVIRVTRDAPGTPTFEGLRLNRKAAGLYVRDKVVDLEGLDERLVQEGVVLESPPEIFVYELLRAVYPQIRSDCFSTSEERRRYLGLELEPLLQLHEWRHPDTWGDESVRSSPSFTMLAEVIVSRDAHKYESGRVHPNTHWSNWTAPAV